LSRMDTLQLSNVNPMLSVVTIDNLRRRERDAHWHQDALIEELLLPTMKRLENILVSLVFAFATAGGGTKMH
jgi:hypothetical protein